MKSLIGIAAVCFALLFVGSKASACNTVFVQGFGCNSHAAVVSQAVIVPQAIVAPQAVFVPQDVHCANVAAASVAVVQQPVVVQNIKVRNVRRFRRH